MDIVHIKVVLEDQFSGARTTKIVTRSKEIFDKMVADIGSTFSQFDKAAQIRYDWKVIDVKQAVPEDYPNYQF